MILIVIIAIIVMGLSLFTVMRQDGILKEAIEEAEIGKDYAAYLISRYEEVYEEKRKLEWQNERLREQVEFFERELATEEAEKKETTITHE